MTSLSTALLGIICGALLFNAVLVNGYYIPGSYVKEYQEAEEVKLKVNSLTSTKTLIPISYYKLQFCIPPKGPKKDNENFGELMAGQRIESSPYVLRMKQEMYCEQLCLNNIGRANLNHLQPNKFSRAIQNEYHNNWIVDNLPSASVIKDINNTAYTQYYQGFPIGFVIEDKVYVNNHVNIRIMYNDDESKKDGEGKTYRIVRFLVEPFSIKQTYTELKPEEIEQNEGENHLPPVVSFEDPIDSCNPNIPYTNRKHTSNEMIRDFQLAEGHVLFTYDVIWERNNEIHWAARWNIYLTMNNAVQAKVHWYSIANALVIVIVLSVMIGAILVRNLQRDLNRYNRVPVDEEQRMEELEEYGWKLVHADVFRPPSFSPMILAVGCGTGAQLLCMSFLTVFFAALGFMSPARRGHLLMVELFLYVLMGSVNGYVTARLYKTFKGKSWQQATTLTAFGFPGIAFAVFLILDFVAIVRSSTDAVPVLTMFILIVLWFGISTPLVFFGAFVGYRQDAIAFPVNTSSIPRQIPDQPWFMGVPFTLAIGGILPFGACFVELYYIMSSVWQESYYYFFSFLFLVFIILIVTCAEITVLFTYFQLCSEDYNWWWRSFCNAGATAIYVLLYSIAYFRSLEANSLASYALYFGYMGLVCLGLFTMTGFIGLSSSLWFNKTIFASIKID